MDNVGISQDIGTHKVHLALTDSESDHIPTTLGFIYGQYRSMSLTVSDCLPKRADPEKGTGAWEEQDRDGRTSTATNERQYFESTHKYADRPFISSNMLSGPYYALISIPRLA